MKGTEKIESHCLILTIVIIVVARSFFFHYARNSVALWKLFKNSSACDTKSIIVIEVSGRRVCELKF